MFKKAFFIGIILAITLPSSFTFAETKSFTISVTIPVAIKTTPIVEQEISHKAKKAPHVLTQEAKVVRKNIPMIMRSTVVL